tara:strand:+ start:654 stop:857 length:204 start_codon:yes stop_codon:yes gene_type:complete
MESPKVEKRKAECPSAPKKKKRKKKKKQSYKQMMRNILKPKDENKDDTKKLETVTGGGVPEKLTDRI